MTDFDKQIRARIENFVEELNGLVRSAAVDAVRGALNSVDGSTPRRGPGRPPKALTAIAPPASRKKRGRGQKRDAGEIEQTAQALGAYIQSHPGERIEQIARGLRTASDDLKLPIKKLLASKAISKKGEKRATAYFPGSGGGAKKSKRG